MVNQFMFHITEEKQSEFFRFLTDMGEITIFPAISDDCKPVCMPIPPITSPDAVFMTYMLVPTRSIEKVTYEKSVHSEYPQKYDLRPFDDDLRPCPFIEYSIFSSQQNKYIARIVLNTAEISKDDKKRLKIYFGRMKEWVKTHCGLTSIRTRLL